MKYIVKLNLREIAFKIIFLFVIILVCSFSQKESIVWLDELNIRVFEQGFRKPDVNKSYGGSPIKIAGQEFERGIGAHSTSMISVKLNGNATRFSAMVGADDSGNDRTSIEFFVIGDKKILFNSGIMKKGNPAKKVDVDLTGIKQLGLLVTDAGDGIDSDNADWANTSFKMNSNSRPEKVTDKGKKYILTPEAQEFPKINGPKVFGARPGNPFLFKVPVTGIRPVVYSAENLPQGLVINPQTGIITGKVDKPGKYFTTLKAKNNKGETSREFRITIGDTICLTPPLGWNGWNSVKTTPPPVYPDGYWTSDLDQKKVRTAADAMVSTGLINHGWSYINIDDSWQGERGGKYNGLQPNENFKDMKELIDHIHSLGLKAGIYSTPWITSYFGYCGGSSDFEDGRFPDEHKQSRHKGRYVGKYRFDANDAAQWVEWGIDFMKYDWNIEVESTQRMSDILKKSGRDIVFSLSNSAKIEIAADLSKFSNCWRTGGDIIDTWYSLYRSGFELDKWSQYSGPGHWNDPDMLIVGKMTNGEELHPSKLTADEQYTHISLWSLLAAPMLIGCPPDNIDPFTVSLLSNDEVIEINQDPLGKSARQVYEENGVKIWKKEMEDGSLAIGLFNTGEFGITPQSYFHWGDETPKDYKFDFSKVGLSGKWRVRDVWRQKDLGVFRGSIKTSIPHHGVVLIRMYSKK